MVKHIDDNCTVTVEKYFHTTPDEKQVYKLDDNQKYYK